MSDYTGEPGPGDERLNFVHAPLAIATLSYGWVLMRKACTVAVGETPQEAAKDLLSKLMVVITHLKWRA